MATADVPEGFPVSSSRWTIDLRGAPTDVLFCAYENINMLTITHTQTMGTIILAKRDSAFGGSSTFSAQTLLGKRNVEEYDLLARQLMDLSSATGSDKNLMLTLGLRHTDLDIVREITAFVKANVTWGAASSPMPPAQM